MEVKIPDIPAKHKSAPADDRKAILLEHHHRFLWAHCAIISIGGWMITGAVSLGYEKSIVIWNDIVCGALLILFGVLALNPKRAWPAWASGAVGFWLCVAPLFLWSNAAAFATDTIMGTLVISFALVIPNIPHIVTFRKAGDNIPPGWSYNPSSWDERIPVIILGWLGFFVARYLAAYQLGYLDQAWDPFFGEGTKNILTSDVSKAWPVSDAGVGAFAYLLDVLMGILGSTHRWRTMPWVVIIFGILIIPTGIVSITLVILQPVAVGAWCTLCLISALVTVGMIPFTFDEVLATIQLLIRKKKEGKSFWKVFWLGDTWEGEGSEEPPQRGVDIFTVTFKTIWQDLFTKPWNLFLSTLVGLWLMFAPAVFGFGKSLADSNHFVGALIMTFAIISMSEVVRTGRFVNILLAVWIIVSMFIYQTPGDIAMWSQIISGVVLILLSLPRGKVEDQRGSYDQYIV